MKSTIFKYLVPYVIGKVGNPCNDENTRDITYREICERAVAAIQGSSYMNLTYKGVMQDKDAQLGCIVDEEAKVVWLNEPVVTGEARSQDKGESKFSPLCDKRKNILTLRYKERLHSINF